MTAVKPPAGGGREMPGSGPRPPLPMPVPGQGPKLPLAGV